MGRAQATHIVPLVGARRRDRLTEALGAAELTLSQRERLPLHRRFQWYGGAKTRSISLSRSQAAGTAAAESACRRAPQLSHTLR